MKTKTRPWLRYSLLVLALIVGARMAGGWVGKQAARQYVEREAASDVRQAARDYVEEESLTSESPRVSLGPSTWEPLPDGYPRIQVWTSLPDRFGALFPSEPSRVGAAVASGGGYAYQSQFKFPNDWSALAQITIAPLRERIPESQAANLLAMSHKAFLRTIGARSSDSTSRPGVFGTGNQTLEYAANYLVSGVGPVVSEGFWLFDGDRIIKVGVVYPSEMPPKEQQVVRHFSRTFTLFSRTFTLKDNTGSPNDPVGAANRANSNPTGSPATVR